MKKNLLLTLLLMVIAFSAKNVFATPAEAKGAKVICENSEIKQEDKDYKQDDLKSKCYLIMQITPDSETNQGFYGFNTVVELTDLVLVDVVTNPNEADYAVEKRTSGQKFETAYTQEELKCDVSDAKGTASCAFFYDKTGGRGMVKGASSSDALQDDMDLGYSAIGYYEVAMPDGLKGKTCGKICVKVDQVPEKTTAVAEMGRITPANDGDNCDEITLNPFTGSFISYAVLAALAFISISVIAISKKNNKFYKV